MYDFFQSVFFFSSRRRHTRWTGDWSSDVCSSDLGGGAANTAATVGLDEMRPVDLIVCGSVVVNRNGVRVGKGAGYCDIEVALLTEAGLIRPDTAIVTTVHQLQVVDDGLPETEHDFSVDVIVTPDEVIECGPPRRPIGIIAEHLTAENVREIPVLRIARDKG